MAIVPVLCVTLTPKFFYENIGAPPLEGTGTVLNAFDNIISVQESLFGFPDSGVKPLNPSVQTVEGLNLSSLRLFGFSGLLQLAYY